MRQRGFCTEISSAELRGAFFLLSLVDKQPLPVLAALMHQVVCRVLTVELKVEGLSPFGQPSLPFLHNQLKAAGRLTKFDLQYQCKLFILNVMFRLNGTRQSLLSNPEREDPFQALW